MSLDFRKLDIIDAYVPMPEHTVLFTDSVTRLVDRWASRGLWKWTRTLELQCDETTREDSRSQQDAVVAVLESIPKDTIEALTWGPHSRLQVDLFCWLSVILKKQS